MTPLELIAAARKHVYFSNHALDRMESRGVSVAEVVFCIQMGNQVGTNYVDEGLRAVHLRYHDVDVIVAVNGQQSPVVVTVGRMLVQDGPYTRPARHGSRHNKHEIRNKRQRVRENLAYD